MKKYLLVVVTLMVLGVNSASAQAVWGGRIGVSVPLVSGDGGSLTGKYGLELGPVMYYHLQGNWYINTAAMFSIKSFDGIMEYDYYGNYYETTLNMYYITVPVYAGYSFPVGKVSLYAQAGPYFGYKLSESDYSGLKSFDAGLAVMLGINLNRFKIEIGTQQGLINDLDDTSYGSVHLGSAFLGVSYVF